MNTMQSNWIHQLNVMIIKLKPCNFHCFIFWQILLFSLFFSVFAVWFSSMWFNCYLSDAIDLHSDGKIIVVFFFILIFFWFGLSQHFVRLVWNISEFRQVIHGVEQFLGSLALSWHHTRVFVFVNSFWSIDRTVFDQFDTKQKTIEERRKTMKWNLIAHFSTNWKITLHSFTHFISFVHHCQCSILFLLLFLCSVNCWFKLPANRRAKQKEV